MNEQDYLDSLKDLSGHVAVVTGGAAGIGQETTLLLARLGAKVYVCSRDSPSTHSGIEAAHAELKRYAQESYSGTSGSVEFHELDLACVGTSKGSADALRKKIEAKEGRLDILVANAGLCFATADVLSEDGVERCFAVNCLGHFVFIKSLLDLVERTATTHGDARIVITSSRGYKLATKIDYAALRVAVPNDGSSYQHLGAGFQRYLNSKLGSLHLAFELDKRIRAKGSPNIFVNTCHPGDVPGTGLGNGQQPLVGPILASGIKKFLGVFMRHSPSDAAKTQVFLSASEDIPEKYVHGEFWTPQWTLMQQYAGCAKEELIGEISKDEEEWKKLWDFCEEIVAQSPRVTRAT